MDPWGREYKGLNQITIKKQISFASSLHSLWTCSWTHNFHQTRSKKCLPYSPHPPRRGWKPHSGHTLDILSTWSCLLLCLLHLHFLKLSFKCLCVYLDDILIYSKSLSKHRQHVRLVLQSLLENKLYVKAEKWEFLRPKVFPWCHSWGQTGKTDRGQKSLLFWTSPPWRHGSNSKGSLASPISTAGSYATIAKQYCLKPI